ncbi:hypothetical protein JCGZ_00320 [Jatropha curcas]|uniref:BHLH domain-containing protein n=1 Tax=Jatropha curcas TaxID=180498 RepID=A0A067JUN1_JATCU|nr:transcription factor LHW [Jatropha curcas]KDP23204.1 hypothetical protein JCGZ_00320 [Jatropha curcas]
MGFLLREVLRTLCGANQWCYAVFWKIGYQNPKLLIWEECHFESKLSSLPPRTSGIENPELPFGECEGHQASDIHFSQPNVQTGEAVHLLINKMMMNNQVNVVGQGIVGRAAFTGNHEWILANNYNGDVHPPEVFTEIHQQFSAGMQTIAVIPVSPHGVVQLGSSLTMVENMGFVNNVKSSILQLGCVPGALLSDNIAAKECTERIGVPVTFKVPDSFSHLSGNKVPNSSLFSNSYNQQSISFRSSRIAQPSYSQIGQIQDNRQSTASKIHAPNLTDYSPNSCETKMKAIRQDDSFGGQQENGTVGVEVIRSNPDAWLNQHAASFDSRPAFGHQSVIGQFDANNSILTLLEQHVLSDVSPQNHLIDNRNGLDSFITPQMRTHGSLIVNSHGGALTYGRELHKGSSSQTRLTMPSPLVSPQKSIDVADASTQVAGVGLQSIDSSRSEDVPLSTLVHQLGNSVMLSEGFCHSYHSRDGKHAKSQSIAKEGKTDDDLIQALNIQPSQPDIHISLDGKIPGSIPDCLKRATGSQDLVIANVEFEDSCAQPPSADDLYDILGVDFKKQLLNSKWDSLLADVSSANSHMGKDASTFINVHEASSDVFSVFQCTSDSSIFSGVGTDHLLDAVVSRAHSASKQSPNDIVSCKTTLTKVSSSSVPGGSPSHSLVHLSDQVKKESFDLPKSLEKSGTVASGSIRSGCSKDEMGTCSQITSIYRSQLSSWIGHNMRRDSSVSTAYSKKNDEMNKPNRKRLKPGENPRPRPKDRQMIQDRVKELREIVPNGAKCSIDALLERTIKHMLFLQSVTKHADKLKQTGESKILNKEGGLLLKDNFEGGATWAFEVGSQSMVCPIIVEDLNPPRQMLVEMLCEERGFFLEIADLIRGLGLTILKGVMEARNDKIWALFAVEANRDVTRMEVFMSLVRLLEQTVKGGGATSAAALENNMIVHHSFPQATSIPATGRPNSLQ